MTIDLPWDHPYWSGRITPDETRSLCPYADFPPSEDTDHDQP